MKTIYKLLLILAAAGTTVSCNKWLDILPEDTTTEKQLFSDAGGYHTAINGMYQTMATSSLYGQNLTWGFTSALSQYYNNSSIEKSQDFSYTEEYDYESREMKGYGEQIWQTAYNVIANANNVLQHLETAEPTMFPEYEQAEMDVIKGECLAIRALMHFELLRLFAVAPVVDINAKAIPYVTKYPSPFTQRGTVKSVLDNVLGDFKAASDLLAVNDTTTIDKDGNYFSGYYMGKAMDRYRLSNAGRNYFFTARGSRLNYVAINALMARVYAYSGELQKAAELAGELVKTYTDEKEWYTFGDRFTDNDTDKSRPHKMIEELLVSFYHENLSISYEENANVNNKSNSYFLKNLDNMFKDTDDYRKKLLYNVNVEDKICLKYMERQSGSNLLSTENNLLPVMRLSELYFIQIENFAKNGQLPEAIKMLNEFRVSRGCHGNKIAEEATQEEVLAALDREIWKDNIGEGQYFFYCKKNNAPTISNNGIHIQMKDKYTMVIPDSETNLN